MARQKKQAEPVPCQVAAYAQSVVDGVTVAGRLVRLACERHLRDLVEGPARGLRWDQKAANRALQFFGFLRLAEGQYAGQPFVLQPFQAFIVGSLFGWKGADGFRRFRVGYAEMGKGNGKSPLAGGIGLLALVADGEAAAEVYSAAVGREQAKILWNDAKRMVEASPDLLKRIDVGANHLAVLSTDSVFRPVSSENRGLDGKRVHVALIDELHEHPTGLVTQKIRAGTKGRRQALILEITNSGHDRETICWEHHEYSRKVLEQQIENDSWFAYVCQLDACETHRAEGRTQPVDGCEHCDSWKDEAVWPKANPNLGVSVTLKYLREQVQEAEGMPSQEGLVKRLNFCIWTESRTVWIPAEMWVTCARQYGPPQLLGRVCHGGLDLANKFDVNALLLSFPEIVAAELGYRFWPIFWIPRETALEHERNDRVPWLLWESRGWVRFTEGNIADYEAIEEDIKEIAGQYQLQKVAYDPYNATQMAISLRGYGVDMVEFNQNMRNFCEPTKEFERLAKAGRLWHPDNPCLTWMAGNAEVVTDQSGNIRPVKPEHGSGKKVDGIVAAVMSLAMAMLNPDAGGGGGCASWKRG